MTRRSYPVSSILAFAAVYFCAGKFGLSLAFVNASASAVWPPTGLALAAIAGLRLVDALNPFSATVVVAVAVAVEWYAARRLDGP